jgi:hypothetical protein
MNDAVTAVGAGIADPLPTREERIARADRLFRAAVKIGAYGRANKALSDLAREVETIALDLMAEARISGPPILPEA